MIGIQLVSHGALASGMLDSLEMIIGQVESLGCCSLLPATDSHDYKRAMLSQSQRLDSGAGVLVFADMYGATPYNTALYNSQGFSAEQYQVIAGVNLPLLISAVLNRQGLPLNQLVALLKHEAQESIVFQPLVGEEASQKGKVNE